MEKRVYTLGWNGLNNLKIMDASFHNDILKLRITLTYKQCIFVCVYVYKYITVIVSYMHVFILTNVTLKCIYVYVHIQCTCSFMRYIVYMYVLIKKEMAKSL